MTEADLLKVVRKRFPLYRDITVDRKALRSEATVDVVVHVGPPLDRLTIIVDTETGEIIGEQG